MTEGQRKRRKHDQTPKTSREYMEQKDVNLPSENWSNYECFVLQQIVDLVDCKPGESVNYELIYQIYQKVCNFKAQLKLSSTDVRSLKYISGRVDRLKQDQEIFSGLFRKI